MHYLLRIFARRISRLFAKRRRIIFGRAASNFARRKRGFESFLSRDGIGLPINLRGGRLGGPMWSRSFCRNCSACLCGGGGGGGGGGVDRRLPRPWLLLLFLPCWLPFECECRLWRLLLSGKLLPKSRRPPYCIMHWCDWFWFVKRSV